MFTCFVITQRFKYFGWVNCKNWVYCDSVQGVQIYQIVIWARRVKYLIRCKSCKLWIIILSTAFGGEPTFNKLLRFTEQRRVKLVHQIRLSQMVIVLPGS